MRRLFCRRRRGIALVMSLAMLTSVMMGGAAYVSVSTQNVRLARYRQTDVALVNLCDAGVQAELLALWRPFKISQRFTNLDSSLGGASAANTRAVLSGYLSGAGKYTAGVIAYQQVDSYTRIITVRSVGWLDRNANGALDSNEPRKVVDVTTQFALGRSQVFDYAYFVNNYGWMQGFGANELIVNGDMRANGNFDFSGGTPTINGSVYACANDKLISPAPGIVNVTPNQWNNATYSNNATARMRQAYNSATHGAKGSSQFEEWRDLIYDADASIVNNRVEGAVIGDSLGIRRYNGTMLDPTPTQEVTMPDLSDLAYYQTTSQSYVDTKATYLDGTANPNYGQGAYIDVWNSSTNSYQRVTTNGVLNGSVALIGTAVKPIKIHGPVTITQDCVIKGVVQGQGTIYTGRNVHVVGSITYDTPPDFRGNNATTIEQVNEKKTMLALAARASIIMGDTSTFGNYPLAYMTPPFTKGRYDDNGNYIPPYNAREVDGTGRMRYQSTLGDAYIHSIAQGINQLDAVLYTNFVGGGNLGTGGGGCLFNGTIISRDEAMVLWSLPLRMNYDNRIKERNLNDQPLIDLNLPRAPNMVRMTWQHQGSWGY